MSNNIIKSNLTNEAWLRRMADLEDQHPSVSVGGLAADLGILAIPGQSPVGAFGRFVEFARRKQRLSVEDLATNLGVAVPEILALENDPNAQPRPRTVHKLASFLKLPVGPILELAGLAEAKHSTIPTAAVRFAARSETMAELSPQESQAFDELVKVLVESSD
ncbi:MAG TPA: helix-turn-helix transcriptional regulator [Lacipirellulaceae bacterium]|nr:helix-turn-helix transcriptional regulator [Lacipirellulaceae bacterium]HMP05131.1 helix-turn-helix transcriptional regulator [Lacipirellulaceae bacterium]